MMFGPNLPPDHCEQCKDEYERKQQEYMQAMYGYGYIRKKPQKSLAEADPRKFFERLIELKRRAGDEEPTSETLSTLELPQLSKPTAWMCGACGCNNAPENLRCYICNGLRERTEFKVAQ